MKKPFSGLTVNSSWLPPSRSNGLPHISYFSFSLIF
jgi:hypothetical protein